MQNVFGLYHKKGRKRKCTSQKKSNTSVAFVLKYGCLAWIFFSFVPYSSHILFFVYLFEFYHEVYEVRDFILISFLGDCSVNRG